MSGDPLLAALLNSAQAESERALAARYAPCLRFDAREPFLPLAAGYTIFRRSAPSPSFRQGHPVTVAPPACLAIEYALWWDWDIGHLYELEHVWVYVGEDGRVGRCEASWHGGYHELPLALDGEHVTLYSEPGKHAFAPTPDWFKERRQKFKRSETNELAGVGGVLIARFLEGRVEPTPQKTRLAHTYLARRAFEPSWAFTQVFRFTPEQLVPWPALCEWIPGRVNHILAQLALEIPPADYRCLRIGRRGAAAHAPANTLLGLRQAAELGADLVAFEVRQTADGQVVLAAEAEYADARGRLQLVADTPLAELQAIDLGQGERMPTLAQAIELCQQEQLGAYIEFKDGRCVPAVMDLLHARKFTEHCLVAAFQPDWVAEAGALAPGVLTAVMFSSTQVDPVKLAQAVGANYVQPRWERCKRPSALLTPEWVARVRQADLGIIGWPEERPEEIAGLRRAGLDGLCSPAPELLREV